MTKDASRFLAERHGNMSLFPKSADTSWRLHQAREVYESCYSPGENFKDTIFLAEGGGLMRPHHSVISALAAGLHSPKEAPFQIYPFSNVNMEFIREISLFFKNTCAIPARIAENVCVGFGVGHLFDLLLGAICGQGDIILAPESYYHAFAQWPKKWGGHLVCIKTDAENGHKITAAGLAQWFEANAALAPRAKTFLLCNPSNTGALYSLSELEEIAAVAAQKDLLIVSDEVFRGSEFNGAKTISMASIPSAAERTVTLHSGSKTLGVADLRVGWACGPEKVIGRMIDLLQYSIINFPLYLQLAGLAILKTPSEYLETARVENQRRVDLIYAEVERINDVLIHNFGPQKAPYIKIPRRPQAGGYVHMQLNAFIGWQTPGGTILENSIDLARYFANHARGGGVVFSTGFSKGHDDMSLYIAFVQPGYEEMSAAMHDYERKMAFLDYLHAHASAAPDEKDIETHARALGLHFIDAKEPDYEAAGRAGRAQLTLAMQRLEHGLKALAPVQEHECADRKIG